MVTYESDQPTTLWQRTKTGSKAGFDRIWKAADKLGAPVNRLSNKLGAEAFWPTSLDKEADKAARILRSFCKDGFYQEEMVKPTEGPKQKQKVLKKIPTEVIKNCRGLAIFTTMRTGLWVSGAGGSGILIARKDDGTWSQPSGILLHTAGLGFLVGVDIYDCVLVLNTKQAVEAFARWRCTLGGEISATAGPVGIGGVADSEVHRRQYPIFTYLKSRGFYAGVQIDGTVIIERTDENERFYHERISAMDIVAGKVRHPPNSGQLRGLHETLKAAQGDAKVDEEFLPTEPPPADFEVVEDGHMFGVPDGEDPDPYGVLALEKEGIAIKEAASKTRASQDEFEFNPRMSSPIYNYRQSLDNTPKSPTTSRESWRRSNLSLDKRTSQLSELERRSSTLSALDKRSPGLDGTIAATIPSPSKRGPPPPLPPRAESTRADSVLETPEEHAVTEATEDPIKVQALARKDDAIAPVGVAAIAATAVAASDLADEESHEDCPSDAKNHDDSQTSVSETRDEETRVKENENDGSPTTRNPDHEQERTDSPLNTEDNSTHKDDLEETSPASTPRKARSRSRTRSPQQVDEHGAAQKDQRGSQHGSDDSDLTDDDDDFDDAEEETYFGEIQQVQTATTPQVITKASVVEVPKRGPPPLLPTRNPLRTDSSARVSVVQGSDTSAERTRSSSSTGRPHEEQESLSPVSSTDKELHSGSQNTTEQATADNDDQASSQATNAEKSTSKDAGDAPRISLANIRADMGSDDDEEDENEPRGRTKSREIYT